MTDPNSQPDFLKRQEKIIQSIRSANVDALALNAGASLVYLTGLHFHLSERPVVALFTNLSPPVIVLPELEAGKIEAAGYPLQAFPYGEDPRTWEEAFLNASQAAGIDGRKVGVEPGRLRFLELRLLEAAAPKATFLSAEDNIASARMIKDSGEIQAMRTAVAVAQRALQATLPAIQAGVSEKQLAAELTLELLRNGSTPELSFSPIVASGPNSANPHAVPSDRVLSPGDLLILDWGATVDGYTSDLTRTFVVGQADPAWVEIAQVVARANTAARELAAPGVPCGDVDHAARRVIENAGFGKYFVHRTGHGLGLEGHEEPYIRAGNELKLAEGMVFTIEPGIYLPGRGGVRIEDDVLVTASGCESLSDLDRDLAVVG